MLFTHGESSACCHAWGIYNVMCRHVQLSGVVFTHRDIFEGILTNKGN